MTLSIFSRDFWRNFWISIRRARKDKRDRTVVLRFAFLLLVTILYYGRIIWLSAFAKNTRNNGTFIIYCVSATLILVAIGGIWLSNKHDEREARTESDQAVDQNLRRRLSVDGFALSILLARAGSEQLLREKDLPTGVEVITRKAHLDQLQKLDLWNQLPANVRDLLLMPDAHWPENAIDLPRSFETLRCLRWILRVDPKLLPLTYFPKMDYSFARDLLDNPERFLDGKGMIDIWDIRTERNHADVFFSRCYAEAIGRGLAKDVPLETYTWAQQTYNQARDTDTRDLLVAYETVSELSDEKLRYMISISFQRFRCLQTIMDLADGNQQWDNWQGLCFLITESPGSD